MYFTDDAVVRNVSFNPNPYYNYNNSGLSMMSGSEFIGNTGSFYFIQRDSNFWGHDTDWDYMSSAYFKDNMLLKFKDINLAHKIKEYILDLTNTKIDDNYIRIKATNGKHLKTNRVELILYRSDVLKETNENSTNKDWELISFHAIPEGIDKLPMGPITMMRNQLQLPGGTKGNYTSEEWARSVEFWQKYALKE